jgi:hypothetical protein
MVIGRVFERLGHLVIRSVDRHPMNENYALVYNNEDLILAVDVGSFGPGRNVPLRLGNLIKETLDFLRFNPRSSPGLACVLKIFIPDPMCFCLIDARSREHIK